MPLRPQSKGLALFGRIAAIAHIPNISHTNASLDVVASTNTGNALSADPAVRIASQLQHLGEKIGKVKLIGLTK